MLVNMIFYALFLSQIVLISYYYPKKIVGRIKDVLVKFPATQYPNLYPEPVDKIEKNVNIYQWANRIILLIGAVLLVMYVLMSQDFNDNKKHAEGLPLMFGIAQFIPYIFMEIAGFKQFKLMRKADLRSNRTASLQPRKLSDFIAPSYITIAVILYCSYILFGLYLNDFNWHYEIIVTTVALTLCNLLFVVITYRNLSGKKIDPYQANEDRIKQTKLAIRTMVFVSIIASLFMIATTAIDTYNLQTYEIILNSLYMQIIAVMGLGRMLNELKLDNINFDVYKAVTKAI